MTGETSGSGGLRGWRGSVSLRAILCGIGAAPVALTLLSGTPAYAACDTAVSGGTVTCSGAETNPVGTGSEDNVTVNVQPGASITVGDDQSAVNLHDTNRVVNEGTITAGNTVSGQATGINVFDNGNVVINNGTITVGNGDIGVGPAFGIFAGSNNNQLINNSLITGGMFSVGMSACCGNVITNSATGTIRLGDSSEGIEASDGNVVSNAGTIVVGNTISSNAPSLGIVASGSGNTISNSGHITAGDGDGSPIGFATGILLVGSDNTATNSGQIDVGNLGMGMGSFLFGAGSGNTFINTAGGVIRAGDTSFGIYGGDGNTVRNDGTIIVGNGSYGIAYALPGGTGTVINTGVIIAGVNSYGIAAGGSGAVNNSGTIAVDDFGFGILAAADNSQITNSGIVAAGNQGTGITSVGANNHVINTGLIGVGDSGTGILAGSANTITNFGSIVAGIGGVGVDFASDQGALNNYGLVLVGSGGVGVDIAGNDSVLNNYGTIRATGGGNSIQACACGPANDVFNNMAGATLDGRMTVNGQDNTVNNSGLITITDPATPIAAQNFNIQNGNGNANTNPNIFSQTASGTLALRMDNSGAIDGLVADAVNPGGTLRIAIQSQLYANTLVSTNAAVEANFLTITHPFNTYTTSSPFFTVTPIYDSGDASAYTKLYIQLDRVAFNAVPGLTPNQRAVGNALEGGYSTGLTGNATTFYENLFTTGSVAAYDQLSGAGTAAAQDASFSAAGLFNNAMMQQGLAWLTGAPGGNSVTVGAPLGYAAAPRAKSKAGQDAFAAMQPRVAEPALWRAWAVGFGGTRSTDGDASLGTASQSTRTAGGAAGVDHQIGDLLLGVAAGGSTSHFSVSSLSTSGDIDGGHIGAYAFKSFGAAYAAATLNYAHFTNKTERTISGVGATENANGSFDSDQLGGRFELGWRKHFDHFTLTPFAAVEPAALWQRAYTESSTIAGGGSGVLGLSYSAHTTTSLPTFLGAQVDTRYVLAGGQVLSPMARLSWVHEFKPNRQVEVSFVSIPSTLFTVDGARAARDSVRLDTGVMLALNQSVALFANFNGELSSESQMASATGGAKVTW